MSHRVVVSDAKVTELADGRRPLEAVGAEIVSTRATTPEATVEAAAGADALVVDASTPVTADVLDSLPDLRVVGRAGIGFDNIDVAAAARNDVTVVHVPDYCLDEVSTHAVALLLSCARLVPAYDRSTRAGEWDWSLGRPLHRLRDRTLGLLSFGAIARRVVPKAAGYGLTVVAYDPYVDAEEMAEHGVEKVDRDGLFDRADLLSVHAPLSEETRGMVDADALARLPDDAVLVNTGRGAVVDVDAVAAALEAGELGAAGLDVLPAEPPAPDHPILDAERAVVTPHVAWYSEESRRDVAASVAVDVARVLRGEEPASPVDPDAPWA
jgi:D-3-phosphoglycerate dehydrogenase